MIKKSKASIKKNKRKKTCRSEMQLIKFVIAHCKLENRSMSCTFQLICIERFHSATDDPRAVDILTLDEEG